MTPYHRFLDGDVGALVEALMLDLDRDYITACATGKPPSADQPYSRLQSRRWVLEAALGYVLHAHGVQVRGIPLPKRGSSGRWSTRIRRELHDYDVHMAVTAERRAGVTKEAAIATVSEAMNRPEETLRSAYRRAEKLLREDLTRYAFIGWAVQYRVEEIG